MFLIDGIIMDLSVNGFVDKCGKIDPEIDQISSWYDRQAVFENGQFASVRYR